MCKIQKYFKKEIFTTSFFLCLARPKLNSICSFEPCNKTKERVLDKGDKALVRFDF